MILDNENSSATIKWRQDRLAVWDMIIARRNQDYAQAAKHTSPGAAAKYADGRIRATVRTFLAEVLKRAPQNAAADFLLHAPADWGPNTENLLAADEHHPRLIRRSYPFPTWAAELTDLEKKKAEIDADWGSWLSFYTDKLSQDIKIDLTAAGTAAGNVASGVGGALGDLGKGVGEFFSTTGTIIKYAPYAALVVGGFVVVAVLRR